MLHAPVPTSNNQKIIWKIKEKKNFFSESSVHEMLFIVCWWMRSIFIYHIFLQTCFIRWLLASIYFIYLILSKNYYYFFFVSIRNMVFPVSYLPYGNENKSLILIQRILIENFDTQSFSIDMRANKKKVSFENILLIAHESMVFIEYENPSLFSFLTWNFLMKYQFILLILQVLKILIILYRIDFLEKYDNLIGILT